MIRKESDICSKVTKAWNRTRVTHLESPHFLSALSTRPILIHWKITTSFSWPKEAIRSILALDQRTIITFDSLTTQFVSMHSTFFSDEFCDGYPHTLIPTPGYWIECSRAISNQGSAWTNDDRDLHEIDEGITDSPDGSLRDASVITEFDEREANIAR